MKQLISVAVFLMVATAAFSQEADWIDTVKPVTLPPGKNPIRMGVLIGDNQQFNAKFSAGVLITPPTIIEQTSNFVKLYVNTDFISIICTGINKKNQHNYQTFKSIPGSINPDLFPINHVPSANNLSIIDDQLLNIQKAKLHNFRLYYCIKDRSGKLVADLTLEFVLPVPEPAYISSHDTLIEQVKKLSGVPSKMGMSEKMLKDFDKEMAAAKKTGTANKTVLSFPHNSMFLYFKSLGGDFDNRIEYRLDEGIWKRSEKYSYPYFLLDNIKPGKHTLQVRYQWQEGAAFNYDIEVLPGPYQTTSFKVLIGSCITAFFCLGLFWFNGLRQKRALKQEVRKRTELQNQLNALQSRLHPHFVFNALNSIQGLVNTNEIEKANLYMSKFGALLHDIIGNSGQPMHPLAVELKQIEHYMQLEQLRFKFKYSITAGDGINTAEISIPTLLVQPFVENAIKYGIAGKREDGLITVDVSKEQAHVLITIADNGIGYDATAPTAGRGNAMVRERITALNKLLSGQNISLGIRSAAGEGTQVTLYFYDWI